MKQLNEISTNRLLSHFMDENDLAIISTYRTSRTERQNRQLLQELKRSVRGMDLGYTELVSRWVEQNPDTGINEASDERSVIIYGIGLQDAIALGQKYEQSSIIYKSAGKCAEVCTNAFTDWNGKNFKPGQIVRTFNVSSSPTPFNLDKAREIFSRRSGGPASSPVKSNRPFTLTEMYEVEGPKASTFSGHERLIRLF